MREYERLSPLKTAQRPVKDWGADIRAGDCIVAFSRRKLFQLKNEIEVATGQRFRCCVVYGALPPEARREQARLFNGKSAHATMQSYIHIVIDSTTTLPPLTTLHTTSCRRALRL